MSLALTARRAVLSPGQWVRNDLWRRARAVPSLDLRFADNKSLVDSATGQSLVTFTRASSGTFVGSDGQIKTATTNLLLRSEDFSTTWSLLNSSSITADQGIAPNGTNTADLYTEADSGLSSITQSRTLANTATYTASIYLKKSTSDWVRVIVEDVNTSDFFAVYYDINTGQVGGNAAAGTGSFSSASIIAIGSGWYRAVLTGVPGGSSGTVRVRIHSAQGNNNNTRNFNSTTLLWGAQLEQSSTVGEYIPTTSTTNSAPRFDHNPTTGESLGLLVEEQRTNSIRNNTMVGAVAGTPGTLPTNWAISSIAGLTLSVVNVGTVNGINIIDVRWNGTPSATGALGIRAESNTTIAALSGQSWTYSTWVQLLSGSFANLNTATIFIDEYTSGGAFVAGSNIILATPGSELIRYSGTRTFNGATTAFGIAGYRFYVTSAGVPVDITIRIGLPQFEQGAFATSVIPTSTVAVTRSADVASITGGNFGTSRTNLLQRSEDFDNTYWTKEASSISANSGVAPDSLTTADKIQEDSTNASHRVISTAPTWTGNTAYTFTFYAKSGERTLVYTLLGTTIAASRTLVIFNLATGVPTTSSGSPTATSMSPIGNGWYRCVVSFTSIASPSGGIGIGIWNTAEVYTGTTGSGLFTWGAQLETGSSATAYIPTRSVFTSRASSGTYVGGDGILRSATTNLLLRSEEFDNASWTQTRASVSANQTTAPNGSASGDKIILDATANNSHFVQQTPSITAGSTVIASVFAKLGEWQYVRLEMLGNVSTGDLMTRSFNLNTGTAIAVASTTGAATVSASGIDSVGNGWYKIYLGGVVNATDTAVRLRISFATATGGTLINGDSTSGFYLWGAQLEQSSTVGEYIPTTSVINSAARYDHDPLTLSPKGLLLEESRANLVLQSATFQPSSVNTPASYTVDQIAPDGTTTASRQTASTPRTFTDYGGIANAQYTFSVWIKTTGASLAGNYLIKNAASDTVKATNAWTADATWKRVSITATTDGATTGARIEFTNVTSGVVFWGAQLEVGAFPTSYIPTTTTTVTRAADISTSSTATVFDSSWYRQDEGTAYVESRIERQASIAGTGILGIQNVTGSESAYLHYRGNGLTAFQVSVASVGQVDMSPYGSAVPAGATAKQAIGIRLNDMVGIGGGVAQTTDTSCLVPTPDRLLIGFSNAGSVYMGGTIRRLTYWPTRLSNSTLQTITQ